MRKSIILVLTTLFLFSAAIAESDLSSMSADDLTQLRQSVDIELARRIQADESAQTIKVGDLTIKLHQVVYGMGRDDRHAVAAVLAVSNASEDTKSLITDVDYNITQNGTLLATSYINADGYTGPTAIDSMSAKIKPGAVDMQLAVVGLLEDDGGDRIEIDFFDKKARYNEEPYCGTFVIDLAKYK